MSTPSDPTPSDPASDHHHAQGLDAPALVASPELERVRCMGCGYSLKGLSLTSKCPECGVAAHESRDFARNLGGLTYPDVLLGLRLHAWTSALSAILFVLSMLNPGLALLGFFLWILFTVGTCYLADLDPSSRSRKHIVSFFVIVISTVLTVLSPFFAMSLQDSPPMGFLFLLMTLGNALQFFYIYNRHSAIASALAKSSPSRIPTFFPAFTILLHGIIGLPLAVIVSIAMMLKEGAAYAAGIAILYSLPLHGVWLIWLGIRSAYYAKKLSRWSTTTRPPRLPA